MFQFPVYVWTGTVSSTEGLDTLFPSWTSKASKRNGDNGIVISAIKILCGPTWYRQVLSLKGKYCNIQGAHPRVSLWCRGKEVQRRNFLMFSQESNRKWINLSRRIVSAALSESKSNKFSQDLSSCVKELYFTSRKVINREQIFASH